MSNEKTIESLTPEQEALLPVYRKRWIDLSVSTGPTDRVRAEKLIRQAYANTESLPQPEEFWWVQSPWEAVQKYNELPTKDGSNTGFVMPYFLYGHHDAAWLGYYAYMLEVLGIKECEKLKPFMELAECCGWWIPLDTLVIVCERPNILKYDASLRLHCEDGPAVQYPDGFSLFHVHGIQVPEDIVLDRSSITIERITNERNAEIRRIMCEFYGLERYLAEMPGVKLIHEDSFGKLYQSDDITMVQVTNSTAEPDGTFKQYVLPVDRELRPMIRRADGQFDLGAPQKLTARNAVASMARLAGEQYAPEVET